MVTVRYGFQTEVNKKYGVSRSSPSRPLTPIDTFVSSVGQGSSSGPVQRSVQLAAIVLVRRRRHA